MVKAAIFHSMNRSVALFFSHYEHNELHVNKSSLYISLNYSQKQKHGQAALHVTITNLKVGITTFTN